MKLIRLTMALTAALGLSACATVDTATRNAPMIAPVAEPLPAGQVQPGPQHAYAVQQINVRVPQTLTVSEANSYYPRADIVWREDPLGDRYAQVQTIMQEAATSAVTGMNTGRPVIVDIQVTRFHALTQKTRYTIGGTHDVHYYITVMDAQTGAKLEAPRLIELEFDAYGGARALEAMSRGETQKVRITQHVVESIRKELGHRSAPAAPQPLNLSAISSRGI